MPYDYRKDFPILNTDNTIYFDSAATTQKPISVIETVKNFYLKHNANPLRGLYNWAVFADEDYTTARLAVKNFIGAKSENEIVFTRGATEALNLIAYSYGEANINQGDEIVVFISEHHSNLLPWQELCKRKNASLKYIYCDEFGKFTDEEISSKITEKTKIVAVAHISNVLGQINPVKRVVELAHNVGAVVVVDGAQSAPHIKVDVTELDADFFVFSGHKMLAPMGIGVLYGKESILNAMPPFLFGGEMIDFVYEQSAKYAPLPHKFEAGTQNAGGAVGLKAAIDYINNLGFETIHNVETSLTKQLFLGMQKIPHIQIIGSQNYSDHQGIITFNIEDVHPHDASSILSSMDVAIRAGHHCAQPLLRHLGIQSSLRASLYFYNNSDEVDRFLNALKKVRSFMGYES